MQGTGEFTTDTVINKGRDKMQHESVLRKKDTLFLIIDIQERLLPAISNKEQILKNAGILAQAAGILNLPLIISEQYPKGLGNTISELSTVLPADSNTIPKTTFSCMQCEDLSKAIKASMASQVVICGIEAHICVAQTALDLAATGTQVHIMADAVGSRNPENRSIALDRLTRAGIILSNTESALFELLGKAGGDEFKAISKLIK